MNPGIHDRGGRVGAHAAGVRAGVAFADAFMVLAGGHGQYIAAICEYDKTRLLAAEKLLDHHATAGFAKGIAREHVGDGRLGVFQGFCHDHALAGGQAIGFYHNRCAAFTQVGEGGLQLGECVVGRGGNIVALEKILGEGLRALELGSAAARAKAGQRTFREVIHDAGHQWRLGPHDRQTYRVGRCELCQRGEIHHIDGHVLHTGLQCGSRVARRHVYGLCQRRLRRLPGQRVFAPAAADNQYVHSHTPRTSDGGR